MDILGSMGIFVKVVDHGGFSAAAEASDISNAMVTNHIQALERHLGARLLNRTTRRQSLTEIGRNYYAQCLDILARVDHAETLAREMHAHPKGRIRVSAPISLGSHRLVPALSDYLKTYPDVQIELILNDRVVDLVEEGFDVAIRFGDLPDSGLIARTLKRTRRFVCASPAYLKKHGIPKKPEDLVKHNCLSFHYDTPQREWSFGESIPVTVKTSGQLTVNNGPALLMAAVKGIGVVMLPEDLVAADIANGKLVHVLPKYELPSGPLHLVYLPDKQITPKLSSFIDFMLKRFA